MADNAIEKLFEEMREAKRKIAECNAEENRLFAARQTNQQTLRDATDRAELLAFTLNKHIHEGIPVVQAKMQAHEEANQTEYKIGEAGPNLNAVKIIAKSINSGRIVA